jgi:8-oxo-dGTP pyrophosphatase MutT (NUDIX family)
MLYTTKPKNFNARFEVVSCFINSDGKILLLDRQYNKPQGDSWGLPAGKIDRGENKYEALKREVKEETGLDIIYHGLKYFGQVYVKYPEYNFIYHMFETNLKGDLSIRINNEEHKGYKWVTPQQALQMNLIRDLDKCIEMFYFNKN